MGKLLGVAAIVVGAVVTWIGLGRIPEDYPNYELVVVMVGLEDDLIPGSAVDVDVAEQARLFYVGMTRARETLFMMHSYRRPRGVSFGNDLVDKTRSRFLDAVGIESEWPSLASPCLPRPGPTSCG